MNDELDRMIDLALATETISAAELARLQQNSERWEMTDRSARWSGTIHDDVGVNVDLWNLDGVDGRAGSFRQAVDAAIAAEKGAGK